MNGEKKQAWLEATIEFVNVGEEVRSAFVAECMDHGAEGSAEAAVYLNGTQKNASSCHTCGELIRLSLFFPDSMGVEESVRLIDTRIEGFAKRTPGFSARLLSLQTLLRKDWATGWRQGFPPERVGTRFWIVPPWEKASLPEDAIPIILEPGLAFGTGKHATTRHCLQFLEEIARERRGTPERFLDVGCGSGILSIGAALLGTERIVGLEIDPDSIHEAHRNISQSGLTGRILLVNGGPECCRGRFDLLAANLTATILLWYSDHLPSLLTPGGSCILSGILLEEKPAILEGFGQSGLRPVREKVGSDEGWTTILFSRTTGH